MSKTVFRVRGVCIKNNKILLCQNRGSQHAMLPGGHVEYREQAGGALLRELHEELGVPAKLKKFLGCSEHCYKQGRTWIAEINVVFEVAIPGLRADCDPESPEAHLVFFWHPLKALAGSNLQPDVLRTLLPQWRETPGFSTSGEGWVRYGANPEN